MKLVPEFLHQPDQPTMHTTLPSFSDYMLPQRTSTRSTIFSCWSLLPRLIIKQYQPVQPRKCVLLWYVHSMRMLTSINMGIGYIFHLFVKNYFTNMNCKLQYASWILFERIMSQPYQPTVHTWHIKISYWVFTSTSSTNNAHIVNLLQWSYATTKCINQITHIFMLVTFAKINH